MTSANDVTYAGQHPCDGWVDNVEPTLFMTVTCFLFHGHNLKKTIIINHLPGRRQKVNLFVLKIESIIYFSIHC